MTKRILSLSLSILLVNLLGLYPVNAESREEVRVRLLERVKASIAKLGTGTQAQVRVKLLDKTKLKGYIKEAGDDYFVIVNEGTDVATRVPYSQVTVVKGNNLSTGVKVAITVGLFVVLLLLLARNNT